MPVVIIIAAILGYSFAGPIGALAGAIIILLLAQ